MRFVARSWVVLALGSLAACGGGGGGQSSNNFVPPPSGSNNYTAGVYAPSASLADQCAAPRSGTSDRTGSAFTESMFLRSWTNELYLWYSEVLDRNPTNFTTADYFNLLKTSASTPSGRDKDQFHFTYATEEWEALSQSGIEIGYGAQWIILSRAPPRKIVTAFVEANTSASAVNLTRGAEVLAIDGVDVINSGTADLLNDGFFPETVGRTHTFTIREVSGTTRTISMTSQAVTHVPVPNASVIDQSGVPVGYLLFNDHIATAESGLIEAINTLRTANVQDLILDVRYNGGGYLDIASELAFMIAGSSRTAGQPFERLVFNNKYPSTNPITGAPLTPTGFHTTAVGLPGGAPRGTPLPTLNLNRVYVITSANTCSASESIINSLRGVDVEVYQIGSTTCGKPYGFYPQDNCGTTYFSIQFQGLNAKNFGDYPDGFAPLNATGASSVKLNGCSVGDDFSHQLGDANEGRLQAALAFRASNNATCPTASGSIPGAQFKSSQALVDTDGVMFKSPARENRLLRE